MKSTIELSQLSIDELLDLQENHPGELGARAMNEMQARQMEATTLFPKRPLEPTEILHRLESVIDVSADDIYLPNESLMDQRLLDIQDAHEGDILRFEISSDTHGRVFTLLPSPNGFEWFSNEFTGPMAELREQMKDRMGETNLSDVLEDGTLPDPDDQIQNAALFLIGQIDPKAPLEELPDDWVLTQAKYDNDYSKILHPRYRVTLVHSPSDTVVSFTPPGHPPEHDHGWTVTTTDDAPGLPILDDIYDEEISSSDALTLLEDVDDLLTR